MRTNDYPAASIQWSVRASRSSEHELSRSRMNRIHQFGDLGRFGELVQAQLAQRVAVASVQGAETTALCPRAR